MFKNKLYVQLHRLAVRHGVQYFFITCELFASQKLHTANKECLRLKVYTIEVSYNYLVKETP